MAPVLRLLDESPLFEATLIHTGQHYDRSLSDLIFEDLKMRPPDVNLGIGAGSHVEQIGRMMSALEPIFGEGKPTVVLVPGDVNGTLAAGLTANKLGIPVVHLEAGLRSRDRTMPEEVNRILVDHVSDLLLGCV